MVTLEGIAAGQSAIVDDLVSMLSSQLKTSDPDIRSRVRRAQRTHFATMAPSVLTRVHARVSGYTPVMMSAAATLIVLCERDRNASYQTWLWDAGVPSCLTDACIEKAIYAIPFILGLSLHLTRTPWLDAIDIVMDSPDDETPEHFAGRIAVEVVVGEDHSVPSQDMTWIGANDLAIIPFLDHLRAIRGMDRPTCESILSGSPRLSSGVL